MSIFRESIKPSGKSTGTASHFSKLRTRMTDSELLKATLQDLDIPIKLNDYVRGGRNIEGEYVQVQADIVVVLVGDYDIGFSLDSDGYYNLVTGLWGIAKAYNQTLLISCIFRVYEAKKNQKDMQGM